ncbi:hypothetical protein HNR01_005428 [Methylorubrum rhodesianum]|nr:hypothetical protein [Methylorubrum rhodesianum]
MTSGLQERTAMPLPAAHKLPTTIAGARSGVSEA